MLDDGEVLHETTKPKNPCKDQDSVANGANKADDKDIFSFDALLAQMRFARQWLK